MSVQRLILLYMCIPATIQTIILCVIILTKSPTAMRRYKYVIMFVTLSVYQFTIIRSLFCPIPLPKACGMQFSGIIGITWPHDGFALFNYFFISFSLVAISYVISFIWRENSIINVHNQKSSHTVPALYIGYIILLSLAFFPFQLPVRSTEKEIYSFLDGRNSTYNKEYAIYCVVEPDKSRQWFTFVFYLFVYYFSFFAIIIKSVYRVRKFLDRLEVQLSGNTVRLHRMLLRSLIFQITVPILFFGITGIFYGISGLLLPLILPLPVEKVDLIQRGISEVLINIPALFSTVHFYTVIYFTTPYRSFKCLRRDQANAVIPSSQMTS